MRSIHSLLLHMAQKKESLCVCVKEKYIYLLVSQNPAKQLLFFSSFIWDLFSLSLSQQLRFIRKRTVTFKRHRRGDFVALKLFTYTWVIHEGNRWSFEPFTSRLQSSKVAVHVHGVGHGSNPCVSPWRTWAAVKTSRRSRGFTAPSGCAKADISSQTSLSLLKKNSSLNSQRRSWSKLPNVFCGSKAESEFASPPASLCPSSGEKLLLVVFFSLPSL